jgi:hypothetical protein
MQTIGSYRLTLALAMAMPLCAQPLLESIYPHGAQAGSAVRLELRGKRLAPTPRLHSDAAITATPLAVPGEAGEESPQSLVYLLEIDSSARQGVVPLRIETADGISNAVLFTIGSFPQVAEEESDEASDGSEVSNDFPELAQEVTLPVTVEGRLQGAERDIYRVRATKGQRIVAEASARRAGSAIDPNLELRDSAGLVRARTSDSPGLGLDARLSFEVAEDGDYFVVIRDERFSEQENDFYRLTIGDYEYADSVFPLGWSRNSTVQAEFFGGNLGQPLRAEIDLTDVPATASETWVPVPGTPSAVPFLLSDGEEVVESEAGKTLSEGIVMNGRISAQGETDRYSLAVQGGEEWSFELRSGELPGSSLYGVLTISHGDEILAIAGKEAGDPNPYVISTTGQTATYPFVNLSVPPETDEITVAVEDLLGRGGKTFSYRLVARKQGPDFLLTLNDPYINVPRNGSAVVTVQAERRGYLGPLELYVDNLPDDLEVSGGHIAPMSTLNNTLARFEIGRLTLTAKPDAELRMLDLVVRGRATADGKRHLDRRAAGPGVRVGVKGPEQEAVTAEWLGLDLPTRVTPEQAAQLEFVSERKIQLVRGGGGLMAKWQYKPRRPGAKLSKKVQIPRNSGGLRLRSNDESEDMHAGEFRMFTHERTSLGMVNFNLSATVEFEGRRQTLISKPLEVDIVDGYMLTPPGDGLVMQPESESTWEGSIWRAEEFRRPVTVSAIGLPAGVECEAAELSGAQTAFALQCKASASAPEGDHEVEIRAESVLSDEGTTPYIVEPVSACVTIRR